jgi:hypothetical protein
MDVGHTRRSFKRDSLIITQSNDSVKKSEEWIRISYILQSHTKLVKFMSTLPLYAILRGIKSASSVRTRYWNSTMFSII